MPDPPTGTVTFLFTDIEGSTKLWEEHPHAMQIALAHHDALMREAIESNGGIVFKTIGDAFCAAFAAPDAALAAALQAQLQLNHGEHEGHGAKTEEEKRRQGDKEIGELSDPPIAQSHSNQADGNHQPSTLNFLPDNPVNPVNPVQLSPSSPVSPVVNIRVRMALHTGTAEHRNDDYFGQSLNRVARLLAIGHGAQVLVSNTTRQLLVQTLPSGCTLRDMGEQRLKDLQQSEHVWQLLHPALPDEFPTLRSLNRLLHNLPVQMTSFIGREQELAEVKAQLAASRLLTLAGPGGCGKTRLALHVAAELLDTHGDGVWLVELAPLADAALVVQAVASVLNVREEPGRSLTQTLIDFLKAKKTLLVLDNCEHLLAACAQMADTLLRACPDIKIIASSREALGIYGERVYRVPSLSVPNPGHLPSLNSLMRYPSVRLFMERARTHKATLEVTSSNAPALAQICHQLDGIPLALELAAARLRAMSLEQLADRLEDRFRLLTSGSRTALPRQQTLRAAIDWSYDLLLESERLLLRRLSVFAGGWTLEAAEALCADEQIEAWEVLDLLSSLVDKSLVVYEEHDDVPRYHLLATVRQYSHDRLTEHNEVAAMRERHQNYYQQIVLELQSPVTGQSQSVRQEHAKAEYDNIRGALDWTLLHKEADEAAEMCIALADFWETHTLLREARDTLQRCVSRQNEIQDTRKTAQILTTIGWFCHLRTDYAEAAEYQQRSLELCRHFGHIESEANALNNMALIAQSQGRISEARSLFLESLEIARRLGDDRKQAARLTNLGLLAIEEGEYQTAREQLEAARSLHERHQDMQGLAICLCNLSDMALRQGEGTTAERLSHQCLDLFRELGYQRGIAYTLTNLAGATLLQSAFAATDQHVADALALCVEMETQELVPLLLEFRAESQLAQDCLASAMFCLAAAQNLRHNLHLPHSLEEKQRVETLEARLISRLGNEAIALSLVSIDVLSLPGLVEEVLKPSC